MTTPLQKAIEALRVSNPNHPELFAYNRGLDIALEIIRQHEAAVAEQADECSVDRLARRLMDFRWLEAEEDGAYERSLNDDLRWNDSSLYGPDARFYGLAEYILKTIGLPQQETPLQNDADLLKRLQQWLYDFEGAEKIGVAAYESDAEDLLKIVREYFSRPIMRESSEDTKRLKLAIGGLRSIAYGDAQTWPNCSSREVAKQTLMDCGGEKQLHSLRSNPTCTHTFYTNEDGAKYYIKCFALSEIEGEKP